MSARPVDFACVPMEAVARVREFFRQRGKGFHSTGFKLEFIGKDAKLCCSDTLLALAFLVDNDEVEIRSGRHGWEWTFLPAEHTAETPQ